MRTRLKRLLNDDQKGPFNDGKSERLKKWLNYCRRDSYKRLLIDRQKRPKRSLENS